MSYSCNIVNLSSNTLSTKGTDEFLKTTVTNSLSKPKTNSAVKSFEG